MTAHYALEVEKTLSVDDQGRVILADTEEVLARAGRFHRWAVCCLKNCFTRYRRRRRQHEVIAALNEQISREFGRDHRLNIRTVLEQANTSERFLQSIIDSVSNLRAGSEYTPAETPEEEARNTLKFGLASEVTAPYEETEGVTQIAREQLPWYNRTMNDLFTRFPKLRNLPAVSALRLSMPDGADRDLAHYHREDKSIYLYRVDMKKFARACYNDSCTHFSTPRLSADGYVHHEYAHYLSIAIVSDRVWLPKLLEALRAEIFPRACTITYARATSFTGRYTVFDKETTREIAASIGTYASTDTLECAAEVLCWYMQPEYGEVLPRMPDRLEHWVTECFPMLTNE